MDEGYTVNAVISGMENGYKNFSSILDSGKTYFCPLYCIPTAEIVNIFGEYPVFFRVFSTLAGILFILIIFFITNNLFNYKVALLTSFFTSFSYYQIVWSRQARWYTLLELFFWPALFFFYLFIKQNKYKYFYLALSLIFTALAILTHNIALLLPLIMIAWMIIDFFIEKKKNSFKKLLISIISIIAFIFLIQVIFDFNFLQSLIKKISFHYELPYYLNFYIREYWLLLIFTIFSLIAVKGEEKIKRYYIIFPFIIYFIALSFFTNLVFYRYLFYLTPAIFILASLGILDIYDKIKYNYMKTFFIIAVILAFFILKIGIIIPQVEYYLESDDPSKIKNRPYYAYTPQPDFKKAYDYIKNNKQKDDIVISSHPHFNKIYLNTAGYWLKYDYLGIEDTPNTIKDDKEYYVNAKVIDDLKELIDVINRNHGYIIFDYMSSDNRIPKENLDFIKNNLKLEFSDEKNSYSKIWVYKF